MACAESVDKRLEKDRLLLNDVSYGMELLLHLNELRQSRTFTDTIICLGQEEFPCHKNILSASSPYFKAMFTNDLKEKTEKRVYFDNISPWTFKRIIDYVYTGTLEISTDNAQEMLAAGRQFQYPAIVKSCCDFLNKQLHPSNCLGIQYFAQVHSCQELEDNAIKYALENFTSLVEYDEYLHLPIEKVIEFVSSDLIEVRDEETVFDAVIRWIKFDRDDRKTFLFELLQEVRLPVIARTHLRNIEQESLIQNCDNCLLLVRAAQAKHETIHDQYGRRRRSMQDSQFHPRPSTVAKEVIVVIGGVNGYVTRTVEMYDPHKDMWSSLPELPKAVTWFSASAVVNCIILAGGIVDGRIMRNVWKFDTCQRIWLEMPSLSQPRAKHVSAVLKDRLYIFGGVTYTSNFEVVDQGCIECFDPSKNSWTIVGHSSFPRTLSKIVSYNVNLLIEVGGLQGEAKVNTMECYEGSSDSSAVKPLREHFILPEAIEYAQIVVLQGVFYIIWEDSKKVITLDPEKRTFQRLPDLNYCHKNSGATVLNNKLYVIGGTMGGNSRGSVDSKPSKFVECFDPETKEWTIEKPLEEARSFHGCVTVHM